MRVNVCVWCVVVLFLAGINALTSEEERDVEERCCSHGESASVTSLAQCAAVETPEDIEPEEKSVCDTATASCCEKQFNNHLACESGRKLATSKRCSTATTDIGKACCDECTFGRWTGEGEGKEACGAPANGEDMSPNTALRKNAYYKCCVEAAETPTTTRKPETTTKVTTPKPIRTTTKKVLKCKKDSCDHECDDEGGVIKCTCRSGYRLQADKKSCKDINECAESLDDLCTVEGTVCHNIPGAFKCVPLGSPPKRDLGSSCPPGFKMNVANQVCDDINECQLPRPPCPKYLCENTIGGYKCAGKLSKPYAEPSATEPSVDSSSPKNDICPPGFRAGPDDECLDIDECEERLDDCQRLSQHCINTHGSFFCQDHVSKRCAPGFKVNSRTGICEDIDECEESSEVCRRTEVCVNLPGAYNCKSKISTLPKLATKTCQEGTRLRPGGSVCEDIDECREGTHLCDDFQNCINTYGAHECRCKNGFELDSSSGSCVDVDECALKLDSCSPQQQCINQLGSYSCKRSIASTTPPPILEYEYYYSSEEDDSTKPSTTRKPPTTRRPTTTTRKPTTTTRKATTTTRPPTTTTIRSTTEKSTTTKRPGSNKPGSENSNPDYPDRPEYPNRPGSTNRPDSSPTPYYPDRPEYPNRPSNPNRPSYPSRPPNSNRPDSPSRPDRTRPDYPTRPDSPNRPPNPNRPDSPSRPDRTRPDNRPETTNNRTETRPNYPSGLDYPTRPDTRPTNPPGSSNPTRPYPNNSGYPRRPETTIPRPDTSRPEGSSTPIPKEEDRRTNEVDHDFSLDDLHCLYGYEKDADGNCVDSDECVSGQHTCKNLEECVNKPGGYDCICVSGFQRDDSGWCTVITTSSRRPTTVRTTSTSTTTEVTVAGTHPPPTVFTPRPPPRYPGPFIPCELGYSFDNQLGKCVDIDECATNRAQCADKEDCINIDGGYRCECGARCRDDEDIRTYILTTSTARPRSPSRNVITVGAQFGTRGPYSPRPLYSRLPHLGAVLSCPWGYKLTPDKRCFDIDECAQNSSSCGPMQQCENFYGGYSCQCPRGHRLVGQDQCEDINECMHGNPCAYNSECVNTVGSYRCSCRGGFRSAAHNDKLCEDVDECAARPPPCHQLCANTWGSHRCYCTRGYRLHQDNRTCVDIDECSEYGRGKLCAGSCINEPGSFRCSCPPGYRTSDDGRSCIDVDECESGEASCGRGAGDVCQNTRGGYHCHHILCPRGYRLEGKHRCSRVQRSCQVGDWSCLQQPSAYSYHFITFVANIYLPSGSVDLFTMHGPSWRDSVVSFEMSMIDAQGSNGVQPADLRCFDMRPSGNVCVVSLVCSLAGPQVLELELRMELHQRGQFAGNAVARLVVIVSQYDF